LTYQTKNVKLTVSIQSSCKKSRHPSLLPTLTLLKKHALLITMKNWCRATQSGQPMRTILEIASDCHVWFLSEHLLLSEDWHLEMMKTVDRPETSSKTIFITFFKQN